MKEPKRTLPLGKGQASTLSTTATRMTKTYIPEPAGLMSQSLHPSPTIRQILPARIRHIDRRDVVFVGQNFVQLREFLPSGHLTDVTGKYDLEGQILDAKVISSKFEPVSFVDQVFKQEFTDYEIVNGDPDLPPQILVVSTTSSEIVFLYARDCAPGVVEFVSAKRRLLADIGLQERYGNLLAVDHE